VDACDQLPSNLLVALSLPTYFKLPRSALQFTSSGVIPDGVRGAHRRSGTQHKKPGRKARRCAASEIPFVISKKANSIANAAEELLLL
jgi:hypothetical protein